MNCTKLFYQISRYSQKLCKNAIIHGQNIWYPGAQKSWGIEKLYNRNCKSDTKWL